MRSRSPDGRSSSSPLPDSTAACSGAATAAPASSPSAAPAASAAASSAAASAGAASAPAAGGPVIMTATVGSNGTLVVASSNGMTVYTFDKDVANGGTSACTGGCITKWPALTVPAGSTPTGCQRDHRQARDDHPGGRRHAPGDVQRQAALLLLRRQGGRRLERDLHRLVGRQAMINLNAPVRIRASIPRIGWLSMPALPILLAACGQGGTTGY